MAKLLLCGNYMLTSVLLCFLISASLLIGAPAYLLGIPTPPPYRLLAGQSIAHGVNFANAGSGVTYTFGTTPSGAQVDNFELFLRKYPYSKVALANSLTLVGVDGDDYVTFNGNFSTEGLVYINRVVTGVGINLQRLYDMGLRDVMVLQMVWCLVALDWATAVAAIRILQDSLFTHCVSTEVRRCGGIPKHPTMWAWNYIVNLYATKPGFLLLADARTLLKWWRNNVAIQEPAASPLPQPDMSLAIGELQQAVNSILAHVNYSESLGLLEGVDVAALLGQLPAGKRYSFPSGQSSLPECTFQSNGRDFLKSPGKCSGIIPCGRLLSRL
ncbi:unnamed protein product [Sphagnum troendelagicum]|uniref:Uncharacterized protein n=1 Tax=Sphagnum troendelagicum TaxID=128251 RepID=A0ABP0TUR9_9BRYO